MFKSCLIYYLFDNELLAQMALPSPIRTAKGKVVGSKPNACVSNLPIKKNITSLSFSCCVCLYTCVPSRVWGSHKASYEMYLFQDQRYVNLDFTILTVPNFVMEFSRAFEA